MPARQSRATWQGLPRRADIPAGRKQRGSFPHLHSSRRSGLIQRRKLPLTVLSGGVIYPFSHTTKVYLCLGIRAAALRLSAGEGKGLNARRAERRRPHFHRALLCTLGPSSLNPPVIRGLEAAGATGFRINLSHTRLDDLEGVLGRVREASPVPVTLDTEGAQIRTGDMGEGITLKTGRRVRLVAADVRGDESTIPLHPGNVVHKLRPRARVSVDFYSALLRVDRVTGHDAEAVVISGGRVKSHRAVSAYPAPALPMFSRKDLAAVRIGRSSGIRDYAISFCDRPEAVLELRRRVGKEATIYAKIESRQGVEHLAEIAFYADRLIVDRGDLSREVQLAAIPLLQKAIIRKANAQGTPVYVATNLVESMVTTPQPNRAEVNDVINTLLDGASGLVLAAETAIGKYPVEAAEQVAGWMSEFERSVEGYRVRDLLGEHPLAAIHGRRPDSPRL